MKHRPIGFIGGGNMACSLIGGLIADGCKISDIWVADPNDRQRSAVQSRLGVNTTASNTEVVAKADVIVFAVKPQIIKDVAEKLGAAIRHRKGLVISIAAGIRIEDLDRWLGSGIPIVRAMPNIAVLVRSGATALYANPHVSDNQRSQAESIMRAVGLTLWLDQESQMDAVTALSGSGPAYFFLIIEVLENAAIKLGLPHETARLLALQTAFGAAKMALETTEECATLRERVTSPGGTTEQAITVLQQGKIQDLFDRALQAAHHRAMELAELLGSRDG
ncbi:MAG TPA: pyrroline-5-carboxylate reductase [Gammaproteobacteria bacterium]